MGFLFFSYYCASELSASVAHPRLKSRSPHSEELAFFLYYLSIYILKGKKKVTAIMNHLQEKKIRAD